MDPQEILAAALAERDWIVAIRRDLHRVPELGYEEVETGRLIRAKLEEMGVSYRHPVAETGVVATLGNGDGPCVALRADMDALPITEASDVPFRSEVDGRMHACGHDGHTAMLLGAARILKQREAQLHGTVKLLFQPAEEGGAGGARMCEEGVLDAPRVQRVFGLHVLPLLSTGSIGARAGAFFAATGRLEIEVVGQGGHAAMPHLTVDPVITAAKVITELQTIVSRELDPLEPGVVSITGVNGGEVFNVIPPSVRLVGTIRSLSHSGLELLKRRVAEVASHVAAAHRCEAHARFPGPDYPATVNDEAFWTMVRRVSRELVGDDHVHEIDPLMGGEDFAYYAQQVPGCFVGLGVRNESIGAIHGLHHPKFKMDEDALPIGAALHAAVAVEGLRELGQR
jgi:amidohydrolase